MSGPTSRESSPLADIGWRLARTVEMLRGSVVDVEPYTPGVHEPLVSFTGVPGLEEVDRYWLNSPFAFASINYDAEENEHRYYVVEPELDAFERELLDDLAGDIRDALVYRAEYEPGDRDEVLLDELERILEEYGVSVEMPSFYRLFYYLHRTFSGYGRIDPIMADPYVEDVSCDGYDVPLFVYHDRFDDLETNVRYGKEELDGFVVRLAQQSGRHVSVGDPTAEVTLPDGSRGELALGDEVTPRGSAFTIRKYAEEPFTPVKLVEYGTVDLDMMAYFWLAIENNKSLVFAGGTASGKTTSMNAISMFITPRSKVLTIEDTRELSLYHDNWLANITREGAGEGAEITMYDLLRSALRHRPEYIIVGEVRGEEAMTLFQAMNTGHTTYSTMHADSVQTVINRLENEPINVPRAMIQSLDILSVQTLTYLGDRRVRRTKLVAEIEGIDQRTGDLDYSTTFRWVPDEDGFRASDSKVLDDIQDDRGWSRAELLRELDDRKRVLRYLLERGVDDYRQFTAIVNEYYADKERVLDRIDVHDDVSVGFE